MKVNEIKQTIKSYFNLAGELESETAARKAITDNVSFRGSNAIILAMAIVIASLGLNTNSPAVIIGAMLISPLMGPIIGMGLGVGTYDFNLIKRSGKNLIAAALISVVASTLYFIISPVSEGRSELLARTSPTIYDVLIGFFGGGAGIVAIACKNKGNVIPGVAIATALMPPLCTAGYGLATLQIKYFIGAFYLFIINSIFISFATLIGVKLMKFKEVQFLDDGGRRKVKRIVVSIVVLTALPAAWLTFMMIRDNLFESRAEEFVQKEFNFPNTQVLSKEVYTSGWDRYISVTLIGEKLDTDSLTVLLSSKLNNDGWLLKGTKLTIKQGVAWSTNDAIAATQGGEFSDVFKVLLGRLDTQNNEIDSLRNVLRAQARLDSLSCIISPEIEVLYPQIKYIALNRTVLCNVHSHKIDTLNVAIVEYDKIGRVPLDIEQVKRYLETRTGLDSIHIIEPKLRF